MPVTYEEILNLFRETDRKFQETDRRFQEMSKKTDRQIQEVNKALGRQGNRLGEFVEKMVRPGVVRLLRERQLPVHQVVPNMTAYDDSGQVIAEMDLLAGLFVLAQSGNTMEIRNDAGFEPKA